MRILFVGAHTDDEVSTAGTLAKLMQRGHEIFVAVFSTCEESSKALGYAEDILEKEFARSMACLGVEKENALVFSYPVRHFPQHRQAILEDLVRWGRSIKPRLVFTPNTADMHQDHRTLSEECRRAFRDHMLLGYESPRILLPTNHMCYVKLDCKHLQMKIECLCCYESQVVRPGMRADIRESLAKLRGAQVGHPYAEAFEVIRWIIK